MMQHVQQLRRHIRPTHVFPILIACAFVSWAAMLLAVGVWAHVMLVVSSVSLLLWSLQLAHLSTHEGLIRVWAQITGLTPVQIMQYDHVVRFTLVQECAHGAYVGHLAWQINEGHVRLLPNGHVDPECECAFCYVWQPVDTELKTALQLAHSDKWPDWDAWSNKSHTDMIKFRLNHLIN